MENQNLTANILVTQKVLNSYIEFNGDSEKFTKYVEGNDEGKNKQDSKIIIAKK